MVRFNLALGHLNGSLDGAPKLSFKGLYYKYSSEAKQPLA